MKTIFAINVHSISDIITNSSTDIFGMKTEKSIEFIKEFIEDVQNKLGLDAPRELRVETMTMGEFWEDVQPYFEYREQQEQAEMFGYLDYTGACFGTPKGAQDPELHFMTPEEFIADFKRKVKIVQEAGKDVKTAEQFIKSLNLEGVTTQTSLVVVSGDNLPLWIQGLLTSLFDAIGYHLG
jgi:hypothetical protein